MMEVYSGREKLGEEGSVWLAGAAGGEAAWGLRILQEETDQGVCFLGGKDRGQEPIQTKFEVCRLVIIRFYSLVPSDFESQEVDTLH